MRGGNGGGLLLYCPARFEEFSLLFPLSALRLFAVRATEIQAVTVHASHARTRRVLTKANEPRGAYPEEGKKD